MPTPTLTYRAPHPQDLSTIAAAFADYSTALVGFVLEDESDLQHRWEQMHFNLATDAVVAETSDGKIAGYIEILNMPPHVRSYVWGFVHPDYTRQGIGRNLLQWAEKRTLEIMPLAPAEARVILQGDLIGKDSAAFRLFEQEGYQVVRHIQELEIEFESAPVYPTIPDGIEIRHYQPEYSRAVSSAVQEAFADHWGAIPVEPEEYHQRMLKRTQMAGFASENWLIAFAGEEVAGVALCRPYVAEDPDMAWVEQLAVRREYRKQGLGLALLQYTFAVYHERGKHAVALGVDTQSLTGALRLYEKAGMKPYLQFAVPQKELRAGVDYTRR